jgi:microcystin-dependent protein
MFKTLLRSIAITSPLVMASLYTAPVAAQTPYLGEIRCFAFNFAPQGWAQLNGQILSISEYAALFALLGTTYGGDGRQTFALPNMQGRFLNSQGQSSGTSLYVMGQVGGSEQVPLSVANLPPHSHNFAPLGSNNDATSISPAGAVASSKARTTLYTAPANIVPMAAGATSATGGGVPVATEPPYLTVNCAIALEGIFPSQN